MTELDDTDRQLIALLRADSRTPVAALARTLRLARGTVQHRIDRLEREGVIVGYTLALRPLAEGPRIRALMCIAVEGDSAREVIRVLRGHASVGALHSTNGRWDIVAELHAVSLTAFDAVLGDIRRIKGVAQTETSLLLSTHKL